MKNIPVAGVDVSKRFSDMCILSPENEVFARVRIYHDLTFMGLDLLGNIYAQPECFRHVLLKGSRAPNL